MIKSELRFERVKEFVLPLLGFLSEYHALLRARH